MLPRNWFWMLVFCGSDVAKLTSRAKMRMRTALPTGSPASRIQIQPPSKSTRDKCHCASTAWGYVRKKGGNEADAAAFVAKLYKNVPVLAKGGRDATTIFLQRNIGDVLVTFESEVISVDNEFGAGKVDAIHPSISIVAENPVAVVERTVNKKGTGDLAKAYLSYLYSDEAQEIAAKHALRPSNSAILRKYSKTFKPLQLFTVNEVFGSFAEAQKVHFNDGGNFDKLYTVK